MLDFAQLFANANPRTQKSSGPRASLLGTWEKQPPSVALNPTTLLYYHIFFIAVYMSFALQSKKQEKLIH